MVDDVSARFIQIVQLLAPTRHTFVAPHRFAQYQI
jgi:hypothetical protein